MLTEIAVTAVAMLDVKLRQIFVLIQAMLVNTPAAFELTASGAVTAGVREVDLNHASVLVAATIADFASHPGIFVVKDTSATGTVGHTLTLTSGTFDGTNNVATLNALGEQLLVYVGADGNGLVLQNTGAVALSAV